MLVVLSAGCNYAPTRRLYLVTPFLPFGLVPLTRPVLKLLPIKVAPRPAARQQDGISPTGGALGAKRAGDAAALGGGKLQRIGSGGEGVSGGGGEGLAGLLGYSDSDSDGEKGREASCSKAEPLGPPSGAKTAPAAASLPHPEVLLSVPCPQSRDLVVEDRGGGHVEVREIRPAGGQRQGAGEKWV